MTQLKFGGIGWKLQGTRPNVTTFAPVCSGDAQNDCFVLKFDLVQSSVFVPDLPGVDFHFALTYVSITSPFNQLLILQDLSQVCSLHLLGLGCSDYDLWTDSGPPEPPTWPVDQSAGSAEVGYIMPLPSAWLAQILTEA